jgi:hypothetical protein
MRTPTGDYAHYWRGVTTTRVGHMNNTHSTHPVRREASFREAGFNDLIKDVSRLLGTRTWSQR